jgi:hypothetical protein
MTTTTVQTQPEPEHIAHATLTLAGVLAGDLDVDTSLAVGSAVAILSDVHPPYPPHPARVDAIPLERGIGDALASLALAVEHSDSIPEVLRIAFAARELRLLRPPTDTTRPDRTPR